MKKFDILYRSISDANLKYEDIRDNIFDTWHSEAEKTPTGKWQRFKKAIWDRKA